MLLLFDRIWQVRIYNYKNAFYVTKVTEFEDQYSYINVNIFVEHNFFNIRSLVI